jgi:hypothetical protein
MEEWTLVGLCFALLGYKLEQALLTGKEKMEENKKIITSNMVSGLEGTQYSLI